MKFIKLTNLKLVDEIGGSSHVKKAEEVLINPDNITFIREPQEHCHKKIGVSSEIGFVGGGEMNVEETKEKIQQLISEL